MSEIGNQEALQYDNKRHAVEHSGVMKKAGIEVHVIAAALSDFAFGFAFSFAELGAPVAERLVSLTENA